MHAIILPLAVHASTNGSILYAVGYHLLLVLYMMPCYLLVVVAVAFMGAGSSGSVLLTAARA